MKKINIHLVRGRLPRQTVLDLPDGFYSEGVDMAAGTIDAQSPSHKLGKALWEISKILTKAIPSPKEHFEVVIRVTGEDPYYGMEGKAVLY